MDNFYHVMNIYSKNYQKSMSIKLIIKYLSNNTGIEIIVINLA